MILLKITQISVHWNHHGSIFNNIFLPYSV